MTENTEEKNQENQVDNLQEPDSIKEPQVQLIEVEQANWEIFVPVKDQNQNIVGFRQI